jgi:hypothetical protein
MKENIIVAFSGGRTSAYMSKWLIDNMSHIYNLHFVYANTGLEHEKTLEFVDKCDKYFGLNLTWVEAVIDPRPMKGTDYTIVNYETACRDNRLFKDMCAVYGLMNKVFIHCTRELKIQPIDKFANDYIGQGLYRKALGIRHDEFQRVRNDPKCIYPLATITKITKQEILDWWKTQPFDLEIEEHYGNCVACYKKSDKKLKMIADENPHYFDAFIELEEKYKFVKSKEEPNGRIIFRHFRTAYEVKNNLNLPQNMQDLDECAEECGSVISGYESPKTEDMIYQKSLFDL